MSANVKKLINQGKNIKVFVCPDYETLSCEAAGVIAGVMLSNDFPVLGLATGSSPVGTYRELIRLYEDGILDFSRTTTFNLDEYYPLSPENDQSYHYFMDHNLFHFVNISKPAVHVPDGNAPDMKKASLEYEAMLSERVMHLQLLGIGGNGHIGFNEPAESFAKATHVVDLTQSTIEANARFFASIDDVPKQAISMGVGSIMRAKKILLVANGKAKAQAVKAALEGEITPKVPASALQMHPDVTFVIDEEACALDESLWTAF